MRIGHASIDENKKARGGRAGDQTKKEVCIREFYKKPWVYLLRCTDPAKAEKMASACETMCANDNIGYDQNQRLTLSKELKSLNWDYTKLTTPCECDCSSFMTACIQCAGIDIPYPGNNAPTTSNMVTLFKKTGFFEVITIGINEEKNLKRGDILVGKPGTHTVMVLDDGVPPVAIQNRRTLKVGMSGSDVVLVQRILISQGYDCGKWGADGQYGKATELAVKNFQLDKFGAGDEVDGIVGKKTWAMLEKYN